MYTKRVRIDNYGPITSLDIEFPFDDGTPKPVILVGENGSGKSILLSHIVSGLLSAKDTAYPESRELEPNRVFKLRSNSYIRGGQPYYSARVDFEEEHFVTELRLGIAKQDGDSIPDYIPEYAHPPWHQVPAGSLDGYLSSISPDKQIPLMDIVSQNSLLFFPPDRFEQPAWLNEDNLSSKASHMTIPRIHGSTARTALSYSPLRVNQDWLFGVLYDRAVFESRTIGLPFRTENGEPVTLPVAAGYEGMATSTYEVALQILRAVVQDGAARFGVGLRNNRTISVVADDHEIVPNIFQLSSGESALLDLFVSILRDFDLSGGQFSSATDIRGLVVIDEIDLHLHARLQYDVLPALIKMFPKVQFIVTSHSPLFVLGMEREFGEAGFALHRLPDGQRINPEQFSEFGEAYRAFSETRTFTDTTRRAIEDAVRSIMFVEGTTDQKYLIQAAALLGHETLLEKIEIRDGGGKPNLAKVWTHLRPQLSDAMPTEVILLFDCDSGRPNSESGKMFQRVIPLIPDNPIGKGIENLFPRELLERARQYKASFIDVTDAYSKTERGIRIEIPEEWTVNDDEKSNLCDWICEHGTKEDFERFAVVFEMLAEILGKN